MELIELPLEILAMIFARLNLKELLALKQLNSHYYELINGKDLFFRDHIKSIDPIFIPYDNPEKSLCTLMMLERIKIEWELYMPLCDIYYLKQVEVNQTTNLAYISFLVNLTKLFIVDCNYFSSRPHFVEEVPNLKTIVFEGKICGGILQSLKDCKRLRKIVICANDETYEDRKLKLESIYMLETIENLRIEGSKGYTPISNDIAKMKNLKKLTIINQQTNSLPCSLGKLFLRELRIEKCKMERLSDAIFGIHTLEELYLIDTNMFELPENIAGLIGLRVLKINNAMIEKIPSDIGSLKRLERIIFKRIPINYLPASVVQLTELKCLGIRSCGVSRLPNGISNMKNLQILIVKYTNITHLPISELKKLPKLESIYMEGSNILNFEEAEEVNPFVRVHY